MALAALCGDDAWGTTWSRVVQHRFNGGETELGGHAVGNVLIVALWELPRRYVQGLDWVGRMLGAYGRVLPMASVPLDLVAEVAGARPGNAPLALSTVRGQGRVRVHHRRVRSVVPGSRKTRPPARRRSPRSWTLTGWVLGARLVVHQRPAPPDGS